VLDLPRQRVVADQLAPAVVGRSALDVAGA
jgi:hypothetical protein